MSLLSMPRQKPSVAADVAFLRQRRDHLQRGLLEGSDPTILDIEAFEGDVLRRWTSLLVRDVAWPAPVQLVLEELYLMHARIQERMVRGGVGDISDDVERLVQGLLVHRLWVATEAAVRAIS